MFTSNVKDNRTFPLTGATKRIQVFKGADFCLLAINNIIFVIFRNVFKGGKSSFNITEINFEKKSFSN